MKNLGIFIGGSRCNLNCPYCAGETHRIKEIVDGEIINEESLRSILTEYGQYLESVTLTSAGEPLLYPKSIIKTLSLLKDYKVSCKIKLYTNGKTLICPDKDLVDQFCIMHSLGLDELCVSITPEMFHEDLLKKFPNSITAHVFEHRYNLVLHKDFIENAQMLNAVMEQVKENKVESFSKVVAWFPRNEEDEYDEFSSTKLTLFDIKNLKDKYPFLEIYGLEDRYESGDKMTLFPDGSLLSSWCS